ncbi:uncharacterized protein ARMOST_13293 [Armillaria ostoyae]|uniref:Uncharacterized protein n=1 Tax=Armillaria ostoyae TaxID=47428 RepID=A0A284RMC0_ARMOS|nr:uncharacterized protein ARMOST_13293 [Armillaria ostoyae]
MEKHSYDVEVGPEIVDSLARSLKDCRRQLKQSEKNAKELEKSNRILTESIEKLKQENNKLVYDPAGAQDSKTVVKVEQADIIPKPEAVEINVGTAASQYEDIKEKYQKEKTKRRQARERCDALTAQLAEVTGEGTALTKRIGELEGVLEKLKKDFDSRKVRLFVSILSIDQTAVKASPLHANERKMLKDAMEQRLLELTR